MQLDPLQDSETQKCIKYCQTCARSCEETLSHVLNEKSVVLSGRHISLMQLCADTCELAAKMMIHNMPFHHQSCELCYEVCETCAAECARFADVDPVLASCAGVCQRCADACRVMAGMTVKVKPSNLNSRASSSSSMHL
jgi:hypothetical protein